MSTREVLGATVGLGFGILAFVAAVGALRLDDFRPALLSRADTKGDEA